MGVEDQAAIHAPSGKSLTLNMLLRSSWLWQLSALELGTSPTDLVVDKSFSDLLFRFLGFPREPSYWNPNKAAQS
jgi:hypothetical protein